MMMMKAHQSYNQEIKGFSQKVLPHESFVFPFQRLNYLLTSFWRMKRMRKRRCLQTIICKIEFTTKLKYYLLEVYHSFNKSLMKTRFFLRFYNETKTMAKL